MYYKISCHYWLPIFLLDINVKVIQTFRYSRLFLHHENLLCDSNNYINNSSLRVKAANIYNCQTQSWAKQLYQFIHIEFFGIIK